LQLTFGQPVDECADRVNEGGAAGDNEAYGEDAQLGRHGADFPVADTKDGYNDHVDGIEGFPAGQGVTEVADHDRDQKQEYTV